jgi:nitrate/nitrite transporter NarK
MHALLGRRDVRLLLAGQTLSMFGDWAMIIVLGIWAKVLTGSNAQAGLVFFVFALAGLAAPLGGLLVDRVSKRPLMIATHVALAGVVCLLLFVHDRGDLWLLYVVTALYVMCVVFLLAAAYLFVRRGDDAIEVEPAVA